MEEKIVHEEEIVNEKYFIIYVNNEPVRIFRTIDPKRQEDESYTEYKIRQLFNRKFLKSYKNGIPASNLRNS